MNLLKLATLLAVCLTGCGAADLDEDGFDDKVDCDDDNAAINPDADEVLGNDVDEDCDGQADPFPDADGDGVDAGEDCDDDNADIYPGATEILGNDIDEDCDGEAQPYAFVGGWTLTQAAFVEGDDKEFFENPSGSLDISDDLDADLVFASAQQNSSLTTTVAGTASPGDSDSAFSMVADGELVVIGKGETKYIAKTTWDCTLDGSTMDCAGVLIVGSESQEAEMINVELAFSQE